MYVDQRCQDCGNRNDVIYARLLQLDTAQHVILQPQQVAACALQKALAHTVMMTKLKSITPVLADLHWLPVRVGIEFKIALLTFKTLTIHQLNYLIDQLQPHWPLHNRGLLVATSSAFLKQEPALLLNTASHTACHAFGTVYRMISPAT